MGNGKHYLLVKEGAQAVEKWRQENPETQLDLTWTDLSNVILSGLDLSYADLRWCNLSKVNLEGTDLSNADLSKSNLSEAVMVGTNLCQTKLHSTNLSGANLVEADLRGASLIETELDGADLSDADFSYAVVERVELKNTKGCELTEEQRENNWKSECVKTLSRGHKFILFSFLTFLALIFSSGFFMGPRLDKSNPRLSSIREYVFESAFAILYIGIIVGCVYIASDKGYTGIMGFILGMLLFLVGLIILTLLPDLTKKRMRRRDST